MELESMHLNDAAMELIGLAKRQAAIEVEEKTRTEVALDHGIDKLTLIVGLCEHVGPATEEGSEAERTLSAWVRRALGNVPIFSAGTPLHRCKNALGSEGFHPDWQDATVHAKDALDILNYAKTHRDN